VTLFPTSDGPVEVGFDEMGRPVVTAASWDGAAFGLGWACGIHRSGQMDLLRRRAHGRLAETAGPDAVPGDVFQRILGLSHVAARCLDCLPADQRRLLDRHAAGVNRAWAAGQTAEPWRPLDTVAVAQQLFQALVSDGADNRMVEVMRRTLPTEVVTFLLDGADEFAVEIDGTIPVPQRAPLPAETLRALMAQPPGDAARIVVADRGPAGSNAWAIAGQASVVLANDMHLELTNPSLLYAVRLVLPGLEVAGVTVPGLPMLIAGTNSMVSWGFTRLPADVCDLREIEEGPAPGTYMVNGAPEPFTTRREVVRVLGHEDVDLEVRQTRWGPVTGQLAGRPMAFWSTLLDPRALDFSLLRVHVAASSAEAADVLNDCGLPPLNAVIADTRGDVLWTVAGRFPPRGGGPRGFAEQVPAEAADIAWLPPNALPRRRPLPGGFVVTCNNGNADSRAAGLGWNFFPGCRARRARDELAAGRGGGVAGSARLQLDLDASYYDFYRDLALKYLAAVRAPAALAPLRDEVAAWCGTAHHDEYGLALLVVFRDLVREQVFAAVTRPCQRYDAHFTYCYHGCERPLRRLLAALDDGLVPTPWPTPAAFVIGQLCVARKLLTRLTGSDAPARWGVVNRLAISAKPTDIELSGCAESLLVAQPDFGAAMRMVVDLTRPGAGLLSVPGSPDGSDPPGHLARWAEGVADPLTPLLVPVPLIGSADR
jgi:penicillin G amidase